MKNRDMFYQNIEQGYQNPGMFIPPSGYNMNSNYQAYGNFMQNNQNFINKDEFDNKISSLERQIKNLDIRIQKLENINADTTDNFYMI